MITGTCDLMGWQNHAGRSRYLDRKGKKTKKLRLLTRARSSARRTKVKRCKSAAYRRRKTTRFMSDLLRAGHYTHCQGRLKRPSPLSQPIYGTIIRFGPPQTT